MTRKIYLLLFSILLSLSSCTVPASVLETASQPSLTSSPAVTQTLISIRTQTATPTPSITATQKPTETITLTPVPSTLTALESLAQDGFSEPVEDRWEYRMVDFTQGFVGIANIEETEIQAMSIPLSDEISIEVSHLVQGLPVILQVDTRPESILLDKQTGDQFAPYDYLDRSRPGSSKMYIRISDLTTIDSFFQQDIELRRAAEANMLMNQITASSMTLSEAQGNRFELSVSAVAEPETREFTVEERIVHCVRIKYVVPTGDLRRAWLAYGVMEKDGTWDSFVVNSRGLPMHPEQTLVEDPKPILTTGSAVLSFIYIITVKDGQIDWNDASGGKALRQSGMPFGMPYPLREAITDGYYLSSILNSSEENESSVAFLAGKQVGADFVIVPNGKQIFQLWQLPPMQP